MNHVMEPLAPPHTCCVIPGRGKAMEPRGFFECGDLVGIDPRVYVSWAGAEVLAEKIGWVSGETYEQAKEAIADLEGRVEELEAQLSEQDAVIDAIDTIESADFRARRKPGKRAKPKTEEVPA